MSIQLQVQAWSTKRVFVMCCSAAVLSTAMISASAWAQDADDGEKTAKVAEAAVRAKEEAIKRMTAQLEAHQKALQDQQKMMEAQIEAQQNAFREHQKQFEAKQQEFQRARANPYSTDGQRPQVAPAPYDPMKLQQAEAALAQLQAVNQKMKSAPLPENALTRVFALKYGKPGELSRVLADIVGERGMRTGIDERSNSLVVSADDKTMSIVDALIQKLDRSAGESQSSDREPQETLQLRIVWLLDGADGKDPSSGLVSPQVLDALKQLGFEDPSVVCQQMTTLTLDERNRGRFGFTVPVLVNSQLFELSGNGSVTPSGTNRFALQFEFEVQQQQNPQKTRLGGSILTPLAHYTVMGTTTFVESSLESPHPGVEPRVKPMGQHLSAFVVYLDRAPEFPAEKPAEEAPSVR